MKIGTFRRGASRIAAVAGAVLVLGSVVVAQDVSAGASAVVPGGDIYATNKTAAQLEGCSTEWHWVINGVGSADAADLPAAIAVTWSDDSTASATLDDINGGAAHYSTTSNMPPVLTVKEAKATWPSPTDLTSYNNFVLSHTPCPVEETTTTVEETTTTVEETTTTVEETTTTVEETTTTVEETTTTVEDTTTTVEDTTTTVEDTTTTVEDTTTTVEETTTSVESEVPTTTGGSEPTTTEKVESQSPGGELPATGSDASSLMLVGGLVLLAGGSLAMSLGRRSRHA